MFANPFLHWIEKIYTLFIKSGNNLQSLFLLYMRVTWGHQFMRTGLGKLQAIDKAIAFFKTLNIAHPELSAHAVAWSETIFGCCLFIGFASRAAAIPLIIIMLTALSTAHAPEISNFRFLFEPLSLVKQEPYPFLVTAILVFCFGPGRISVDAWLKRWAGSRRRY